MVAGHRGYYLVGDGVDLNQALITYGLDFLREKGYTKIQPPFFMNKSMMSKTAQLEEFDEALYKVRSRLFSLVLARARPLEPDIPGARQRLTLLNSSRSSRAPTRTRRST